MSTRTPCAPTKIGFHFRSTSGTGRVPRELVDNLGHWSREMTTPFSSLPNSHTKLLPFEGFCSRLIDFRMALKFSQRAASSKRKYQYKRVAVGMSSRNGNPPQRSQEVSREEVERSPAVLHQYNFTLIGTLGFLLQVKHAAGSPSPFDTDLVTMLMFIAVFLIYICSLATVKTLHFTTPDLSEFMDNISLLFGSLASILLLLILVRAFGFFTLSMWILYFLRDFVTKKSYRNALGYFWDKVKELFMGLKVKVKELFMGQVKNEAETVVGLQEAGEQTTVVQPKVTELFMGLKVKVKELFMGQVKNEAENAEGLQEAGEQTAVV